VANDGEAMVGRGEASDDVLRVRERRTVEEMTRMTAALTHFKHAFEKKWGGGVRERGRKGDGPQRRGCMVELQRRRGG
jgi:hypothetical protein